VRDLIYDVINNCATSSAVEKINVNDEIVIKNLKGNRNGYKTHFYANFHLKDDLQMEFIV